MARHHRRFSRKPSGHRIDRGRGGEVGTGKDLVAVTGNHCVNLGQGGQGGGRVLGPGIGVQRPDPGMRQRHDDVGPPGAQARQPGPGGCQNIAGLHAAVGGIAIPFLDLRWGKTDHAHADQVRPARPVDDLAAQDGERGHQRLVPGRAFAKPGRDIG